MKKRTDLVTMKGQSLTIPGNEVKVGQQVPDFEAVAGTLSSDKKPANLST